MQREVLILGISIALVAFATIYAITLTVTIPALDSRNAVELSQDIKHDVERGVTDHEGMEIPLECREIKGGNMWGITCTASTEEESILHLENVAAEHFGMRYVIYCDNIPLADFEWNGPPYIEELWVPKCETLRITITEENGWFDPEYKKEGTRLWQGGLRDTDDGSGWGTIIAVPSVNLVPGERKHVEETYEFRYGIIGPAKIILLPEGDPKYLKDGWWRVCVRIYDGRSEEQRCTTVPAKGEYYNELVINSGEILRSISAEFNSSAVSDMLGGIEAYMQIRLKREHIVE